MAEYEYPNFTGRQEVEKEKDYSFWNNWYSQFNPQGPVAQSIDMNNLFNQADANTQAFAKSQMKGGVPGNLNVQGLNQKIGRNAQEGGNQANFESALRAFNENARNSEIQGQQGLGRFLNIGNTQNAIQNMKTGRQGAELNMADYIKSMNERAKNSQPSWQSILGQGVGGVAGQMIGDKLSPMPQPTPEIGPFDPLIAAGVAPGTYELPDGLPALPNF